MDCPLCGADRRRVQQVGGGTKFFCIECGKFFWPKMARAMEESAKKVFDDIMKHEDEG